MSYDTDVLTDELHMAQCAGGSAFRCSVLSLIDPAIQPIPAHASVAFVWPTEVCSIGCAHCSFASRNAQGDDKRLLAMHPEEVVHWLGEAGVTKLVICGGGEPLDEPEFITSAISACAQVGLQLEIYTSGVSLHRTTPVTEYIASWRHAWHSRVRPDHPISVRLSVDRFHEERIGLDPIVDWIGAVERHAPQWSVSIRGLRIEGDVSIQRLARILDAKLHDHKEGSTWMVLPSNRRILVERKGFVFEGRGRLRLLKRRGLALNRRDAGIIEEVLRECPGASDLGRPLSTRLTVTHRRIDLEVHADCVVHILESQAPDLRLDLLTHSWPQIRNVYYRDPILHRVVEGGLLAVASLIMAARRAGVATEATVPFSIERLSEPPALDWVTAAAVLSETHSFSYEKHVLDLARRYMQTGRFRSSHI